MGSGIFTTHWKKVLGGCVLLLLVILAAALYYELRSPVAGLSPYETVNDLPDWDQMTFSPVTENGWYFADVETIQLTFRNDAPDGAVCLSADGIHFEYALEIVEDDGWHSLRSRTKTPRWNGNTDIVNWDGGEVTLSCPVGRDYPSPLEPGWYRIVLPECEHLNSGSKALTVEFMVRAGEMHDH